MVKSTEQIFKTISEKPEEELFLSTYNLGFNDGYLQAKFDMLDDKEKEEFLKIKDGISATFEFLLNNTD